MTEPLKPCPWPECGNGAIHIVLVGRSPRIYQAKCYHCFARGPARELQDEAAAAWNRRPATPTCATCLHWDKSFDPKRISGVGVCERVPVLPLVCEAKWYCAGHEPREEEG